ncbi:MAG: hypothetical protein KH138_05760 [Firmicutes bacterium]|nr:hypothetical protein [Bacillota bacterium]
MELLTSFRWQELLITNDTEHFTNVVHILTVAGVPFRTKVQNIGHCNRHSGYIGGLGEQQQYSILYQVFVKRKHLQQANSALHSST